MLTIFILAVGFIAVVNLTGYGAYTLMARRKEPRPSSMRERLTRDTHYVNVLNTNHAKLG